MNNYSMTEISYREPGKDWKHGRLHPEAAEPALQILRRDLKRLREHRCVSFIRRPYHDLDELELLKSTGKAPDHIEGVLVTQIVKGDTNARIPMTKEQVQRCLQEGKATDLYSRPERKGFG